MNPIKVLLAEDHTILRKGLCSLLNNNEGIEIVGEAENGRDALMLVEKYHPDIVLMDISMPILNGLEATRQIKKRFPQSHIIILTMHTNEEYIYEIIKSGASGYVIKKAAPEELVRAIHAVSQGKSFFSASVSNKIVEKLYQNKNDQENKLEFPSLTSREREVLQLIAEGHTNRKIADILFISQKTVEVHRFHIMTKLDLHSVASLTKYAIQKKIIDKEEI